MLGINTSVIIKSGWKWLPCWPNWWILKVHWHYIMPFNFSISLLDVAFAYRKAVGMSKGKRNNPKNAQATFGTILKRTSQWYYCSPLESLWRARTSPLQVMRDLIHYLPIQSEVLQSPPLNLNVIVGSFHDRRPNSSPILMVGFGSDTICKNPRTA